MKMDDLKYAFGSTPQSVKECIRRSLREEPRREFVMKKRRMTVLAVALAAILALGCIGFAATQLEGLAGVFGFTNQETGETVVNEAAMKHITALNEIYEGKTVRFKLTEGMYSPLNSYVSMGWILEPVNEGEQYYILCNERVGGSRLDAGSLRNVTEFMLKSPADCARTGYLTGEGLQTELTFSIMKIKGDPVRVSWNDEKETEKEFWARMEALIAEGKLPMEGDGVIAVRPIKDKTYGEELVIAGVAELAEEFTVSFDLGKVNPMNEYRVYEGEKEFDFDGFEIHINDVVVTPTDSRIVFDYICDEIPTEEEMDMLMCGSNVTVPGVETWMQAAFADSEDPVMENGRCRITITYKITLQSVYPEELILSIAKYDEQGNPTPLTGEGIRLKLTDK